MKKIWTIIGAIACSAAVFAQSQTVEVPIVKTGTETIDGVTIDVSSDDAEQEGDKIDALNDDDLDAGWKSDPEDLLVVTVGLRFQNVQIPKGATIEEAYLKIVSHESKSATDIAELTIYGNDVDNAVTFNETDLVSSRQKTDASVAWTVNEDWGLWTDETSVDFSAIVQEIVNRDGWASGNALALILEGKDQGATGMDNAREFESFENIADPEEGGDGQNHSERVPKLYVKYTASVATSAKVTDAEFVLAPNPTEGVFAISLASPGTELTVLNAVGTVIVSADVVGGSVEIDLSAFPAGIYTLLVSQDGSVSTETIVKK